MEEKTKTEATIKQRSQELTDEIRQEAENRKQAFSEDLSSLLEKHQCYMVPRVIIEGDQVVGNILIVAKPAQ